MKFQSKEITVLEGIPKKMIAKLFHPKNLIEIVIVSQFLKETIAITIAISKLIAQSLSITQSDCNHDCHNHSIKSLNALERSKVGWSGEG